MAVQFKSKIVHLATVLLFLVLNDKSNAFINDDIDLVRFIDNNGLLNLDHINSVNKKIIKKIVKFSNEKNLPVSLNGLKHISKDCLGLFSEMPSELYLNGFSDLDSELLQALESRLYPTFLAGIKKIEKNFHLYGSVPFIILNGLQEIPVELADLKRMRGGKIGFNAKLIFNKGNLKLLGSEDLEIHIYGKYHLEKEDIVHLIGIPNKIELHNIKSISDDIFYEICQKCNRLSFPDILLLSKSQTEFLKNSKCDLEFTRLIKIDKNIAIYLREKYKHFLYCLSSVREIDDESMFEITKSGFGFYEFSSLQQLSDFQCLCLSKCTGILNLGSLKILSDKQIMLLSLFTGDLNLNGLKKISKYSCYFFGGHVGYLFLDGVEHLDESSCWFLGSHVGGLSLNGLTKISSNMAFYLSGIKNPSLINIIKRLRINAFLKVFIFSKINYGKNLYCFRKPAELNLDNLRRIDIGTIKNFQSLSVPLTLEALSEVNIYEAFLLAQYNQPVYLNVDNLNIVPFATIVLFNKSHFLIQEKKLDINKIILILLFQGKVNSHAIFHGFNLYDSIIESILKGNIIFVNGN